MEIANDCPIFYDIEEFPSLKAMEASIEAAVSALPTDLLMQCPDCSFGNHEQHRRTDGSCTAASNMTGSWKFCNCTVRVSAEEVAKNVAKHGPGKETPDGSA